MSLYVYIKERFLSRGKRNSQCFLVAGAITASFSTVELPETAVATSIARATSMEEMTHDRFVVVSIPDEQFSACLFRRPLG